MSLTSLCTSEKKTKVKISLLTGLYLEFTHFQNRAVCAVLIIICLKVCSQMLLFPVPMWCGIRSEVYTFSARLTRDAKRDQVGFLKQQRSDAKGYSLPVPRRTLQNSARGAGAFQTLEAASLRSEICKYVRRVFSKQLLAEVPRPHKPNELKL